MHAEGSRRIEPGVAHALGGVRWCLEAYGICARTTAHNRRIDIGMVEMRRRGEWAAARRRGGDSARHEHQADASEMSSWVRKFALHVALTKDQENPNFSTKLA